jgi:hypothetical protein
MYGAAPSNPFVPSHRSGGVYRYGPLAHTALAGGGVMSAGIQVMIGALFWQLGSKRDITPWIGYVLAGNYFLGAAWSLGQAGVSSVQAVRSATGMDQPLGIS